MGAGRTSPNLLITPRALGRHSLTQQSLKLFKHMKRLRITVEGKSYEVEVELLDEGFAAPAAPRPASSGSTRVSAPVAAPKPVAPPKPAASTGGGAGDVASPLAAIVVSVDVAVGDTIEEGQKVVTLEAMKMNTIVSASAAGTVKAINVAAGDAVEEGQALVSIG